MTMTLLLATDLDMTCVPVCENITVVRRFFSFSIVTEA